MLKTSSLISVDAKPMRALCMAKLDFLAMLATLWIAMSVSLMCRQSTTLIQTNILQLIGRVNHNIFQTFLESYFGDS